MARWWVALSSVRGTAHSLISPPDEWSPARQKKKSRDTAWMFATARYISSGQRNNLCRKKQPEEDQEGTLAAGGGAAGRWSALAFSRRMVSRITSPEICRLLVLSLSRVSSVVW